MTLDFWRICISNFALYAAVWTLLPILPAESYLMGLSREDVTASLLLFTTAMIGVGPLHAYLGDTFKRKSVLMLSTCTAAICMGIIYFANAPWQILTLMALAGASFGIATTAGITIAIDITLSQRRSAGNRMYAFSGALGMLAGICVLSPLYLVTGFDNLLMIACILMAVSLLADAGVYVAFRAPVGLGIFNIDRFFLPRAWMPAVNVLLLAFGTGLLMSVLPPYLYIRIGAMVMLTILSVPLTRMFVKLSHHCQRGTANTTLQLATQSGLLSGLAGCEWIPDNGPWGIVIILASMLLFVSVTWGYFKRKRVRV